MTYYHGALGYTFKAKLDALLERYALAHIAKEKGETHEDIEHLTHEMYTIILRKSQGQAIF